MFVSMVALLKLRDLRTLLENDYLPSRELSLALTKLDECELWLTRATMRDGEAPEHVTNDD